MTPTIFETPDAAVPMESELTVHEINPLRDSRWQDLIDRHPRSTVFHSNGWLEALRRTYGYEPVVYSTTGKDEPLKNGLVLCRINSRLTGNRLVSLPFSDHCQPLVDDPVELLALLKSIEKSASGKHCKYIELRPLIPFDPGLEAASRAASDDSLCIHMLDLRPSADALLKSFHKSQIQRKLNRAQKEELRIGEGQSDELLQDFFRLMLMTRRRHRLPPQPKDWFRNLLSCLGKDAVIRVAYKGETPVASIFTLAWKKTLIYKYGCSDSAFNNMGGTPLLFWHSIQEAKKQGLEEFDFGKSEVANEGLVNFKDHWGSTRTSLRYYRYPRTSSIAPSEKKNWKLSLAEHVFARLPDSCLALTGKLLYRHIG